ncbi:virion structural protein [Pseudomonas phage 201phi2-1]|uniref:Virion structural protein n=1 Tax=Pseudomonas phage 201phi2-1 TaxID=198110 RepID=B3FJ14_BP201|nr:virion structural protein [Pseudomonas phage 201phi2-1]ABY62981.1 virion structural protein [Pseudomonas phage 201phi2-1]
MTLPIVAAAAAGDVKAIGRELMSTVLTAAKASTRVSSLADLAKPCRVEPITLIDQSIADQPYITDLMKLTVSMFAGYYLQAVNMVMGVGRIDTMKVFDTLNPERSLGGLAFESHRAAVYDPATYSNGLPSLEAFSQPMRRGLIAEYSQEKFEDAWKEDAPFRASLEDGADKEDKPPRNSISSSDAHKIYEAENLAIGKLLNVDVTSDGEKKKLPVLVKLIPAVVPSDTLVQIFTGGGRDTWAHRMFLVKSGQIQFWRDFVMGQDMIDAHMKALMSDRNGAYKAIMDRRRNNVSKSVQSGRLSLADASNIAIISATTMKKSANTLFAKIEDKNMRDKIFDNSYLLLLMVVDERWGRVTIYHRGVDLSTSYRIEDVKLAEKSKGQDITEIFKLFNKQMHTNI